ncbi:MAG: hypothetical protein HZB39_03150 [Planctomycetes bacterium]|nr:hypothetical protein [Planctomycetota bacterium]
MRRTARVAWLALVAGACAGSARPLVVEQFGGMREVMREKHVEPRVRLADLGLGTHTIAVGALAGLAGEVTADAGAWSIATASESTVMVTLDAAVHAATLLTFAHVAAWDEFVVDEPLDEDTLGRRIAQRIAAAGGDPSRPWPLRVIGVADDLSLHVIRGDCPHAGDEATPAFRWQAPAGTAVVLVGFRAPNAAGLLTHHGTEFHLHALTNRDGVSLSGHVDRFRIAPGARVQLAATERRAR